MPANVVLQAVLLTAILIYTSVRDYKTREIPNAICLGVSLLAFLDFNPNNILGLTVGLFVWITVAFMCEEKFGGGDIKLIMAVGIVLGFYPTLYGLIIALSIQIIFFVFTAKSKKKSMPLAPFFTVGFLTVYFLNLNM